MNNRMGSSPIIPTTQKNNNKGKIMGYYVNIIDSNIFIDKKHFKTIYDKMCELNNHDELKRGGSYGGNNDKQEGDKYSRNKWFSWMDWNYPETCSNLQEILMQIGFEVRYDDYGNIVSMGYENKTGNEEYFLACFAGFVPDGNYIEFLGEEPNDYYRFYYADGKCFFQKAVTTIEYNGYEEQLIPCQITESDRQLNEWSENYRKELAEKNSQTA